MESLSLEHIETVKIKDDKIDQLLNYVRSLGISLEHVKDQNDELLDRNKGLKHDIKQVKTKLGIAVEDRAPLPENDLEPSDVTEQQLMDETMRNGKFVNGF